MLTQWASGTVCGRLGSSLLDFWNFSRLQQR